MDQVRPWQVIVMVLGAIGLSASLVWQCHFAGDPVEIADTLTVVDVKSGELITTKKPSGRTMAFPLKNPTSGAPMLFPAIRRDGKWYVEELFLDQAIVAVGKDASALADPKSGEVRTQGQEPRNVNLF